MSPHLPALVALVAFLAFAPRAYDSPKARLVCGSLTPSGLRAPHERRGVWDDADESPTLRRTVWPLANWTVPDFPNSQEADGQVVGGVDATDHQFPHQVSMQITGAPYATQHICGGTLIAEQWVLTAAHCAWGVPEFTSVFVLVGKTNLAKQEDGQQKAWVSQMFAHKSYRPNWNRGVGPHDVALLKLLQPVTLSATVKPAVLPEDNAIPTGSATLSGWGSISSLSEIILPSQLQTTELPINSFETCKKWIDEAEPEEINALRDTNVCAGDLTRAGVSSCQGDSGGPLTQKSASGDVAVIGVVSWGYVPCGRAPAPSVFARVSAYNSWIRDTMSSNS